MALLNISLFEDKAYGEKASKYEARKVGPSIIDLAYLVKTSEESNRDCDDAERIISVAYDIFLDICKFRANPDLEVDRFIKIYKHELGITFEKLLLNKMIFENIKNWEGYIGQFSAWFDSADVFQDISDDMPINADGTLNIGNKFNYETLLTAEANKIRKINPDPAEEEGQPVVVEEKPKGKRGRKPSAEKEATATAKKATAKKTTKRADDTAKKGKK
jgi:hypothetical protein